MAICSLLAAVAFAQVADRTTSQVPTVEERVLGSGHLEDPDDPARLDLGWTDEVDDNGNIMLRLRFPDRVGLSARLDYELDFQGQSVSWTNHLGEVDAYDEVEHSVSVPAAAAFDVGQEDWLSDLVVEVVLLDGEHEILHAQAPFARVAWTEGEALIMDGETAASVAPGKAWSDAAQAAVAEIADTGVAPNATYVEVN